MATRQVWAAAVMTAVGAGAVFEARRLPFGSVSQPGPGLFPMCLAVGFTLVSAGILVAALRGRDGEAPAAGDRLARGLGRVIATLGALLAYAMLLEQIGFTVSTFLLIVFLFRAIEPQRWLAAVGGAAVTAGGSHLVFRVWLGVQLPSGPWGF